MRNIIYGLTAFSFFFLVGCSNEQTENASPTPKNVNHAVMDDVKQQEQSFNFKEFDLDVDYKGINNNFEVEFEEGFDSGNGRLKASIEDEINNRHVRGATAFNELAPKLEKLRFTAETAEEDVVEDVLSVFDLSEDFTEFDLEVKFLNGAEKEYKVRK